MAPRRPRLLRPWLLGSSRGPYQSLTLSQGSNWAHFSVWFLGLLLGLSLGAVGNACLGWEMSQCALCSGLKARLGHCFPFSGRAHLARFGRNLGCEVLCPSPPRAGVSALKFTSPCCSLQVAICSPKAPFSKNKSALSSPSRVPRRRGKQMGHLVLLTSS